VSSLLLLFPSSVPCAAAALSAAPGPVTTCAAGVGARGGPRCETERADGCADAPLEAEDDEDADEEDDAEDDELLLEDVDVEEASELSLLALTVRVGRAESCDLLAAVRVAPSVMGAAVGASSSLDPLSLLLVLLSLSLLSSLSLLLLSLSLDSVELPAAPSPIRAPTPRPWLCAGPSPSLPPTWVPASGAIGRVPFWPSRCSLPLDAAAAGLCEPPLLATLADNGKAAAAARSAVDSGAGMSRSPSAGKIDTNPRPGTATVVGMIGGRL